jgi:2-dehydro-3-deoxygluconokinase
MRAGPTGARFVAVGECMVELFCEEPVSLARAERFRCSFGGDGLQAALAAANLGTSSAVATVVGDDPFAESLVSALERWGIGTDLLVSRPGFTGLYLISLDQAGERSFVYYRKGSVASTIGPRDVGWGEAPDAVLVSGITQAVSETSRAAALEAAHRTREAGGRVVYDVNFRPRLWGPDDARAGFDEILPLADVVRVSAPEETALLTGEAEPGPAARLLASRGVPTVLVGCGSDGAVVAAGGEIERIACPPVECVDSTGAGDALTGAFVHGLLAGLEPPAAARLGVAAGSLAVTRRGGASAIPLGEDVLEMVEQMERTAAGV